jgi:hypothetical protein
MTVTRSWTVLPLSRRFARWRDPSVVEVLPNLGEDKI